MAIILFNPKAKSSNIHKALKRFKASRKGFDDTYIDLTVTNNIESYVKGEESIFLIGGDGTLNHLLNQEAIENWTQPIFLEPAGTGNDFFRSLKQQKSLETSLMNISFNDLNRTYINGMGIGIDGYIGLRVNRHKKKTSFTYFLETIKALIHYKPSPCEMVIDGTHHKFEKTYLVVACNGMYFGGGMKIAPNAKIDDDHLDVLVVHNISRIKILLIFLSIYVGKHLNFKKHVFNQKAKTVSVTYQTPQVLQTDGETFEKVTSFKTEYANKKAAIRIKR